MLAVFGAATTALTLLRLTTGIALPLLPLAFLAPFVAHHRGAFGPAHHGVACATLGAAAGLVHLVETPSSDHHRAG